MKKIKKIGFITTLSIALSKIVYGFNIPVQTEYGIEEPMAKLYGVIPTTPSDPSSIANSNILVTIGKIAIIPVVLLVGIFVVVKIKSKNKKVTKEGKENEEKK